MVRRTFVVVLLLVAGALGTDAQRNTDWTQWRGPNRDGAAPFAAPQTWPEQLTRKWTVDVGAGYATPIVVGNRVYVFARQGDNELMMALDADTGKQVWKTAGYPAPFTMMAATKVHGPGPKSTPVFANGRLYSIGMTGVVTAWDAASGKVVWQKPGDPENLPFFTSHAFSPLVFNDTVIFQLGGEKGGSLSAFDLNTGAEKWSWKGDMPGYGSPVLARFGNSPQLVTITEKLLIGLNPATGALLWQTPWVSPNRTNSITPVAYGQMLIVSGNGPQSPTAAFTVVQQGTGWKVDQAWANPDVPLRFSNAVVLNDVVYGLSSVNSGQYFALDAKTGKTLWRSEGRQAGNAALATAGSLVLSLESEGELVVLRGSQTAFEPVKRYKLSEAETWTQGVYAGNRIFIKDVTALAMWTIS